MCKCSYIASCNFFVHVSLSPSDFMYNVNAAVLLLRAKSI